MSGTWIRTINYSHSAYVGGCDDGFSQVCNVAECVSCNCSM